VPSYPDTVILAGWSPWTGPLPRPARMPPLPARWSPPWSPCTGGAMFAQVGPSPHATVIMVIAGSSPKAH